MNERRITSWSYSRLQVFESCKYRAELAFIERVPEGQSDAALRGTTLHKAAEDFVGGKLPELPQELVKFSDEFQALRAEFEKGNASLEGEWGFGPKWEIVPWREATGRVKCDAVVQQPPDRAVVIDYKTGKRAGKEIRHGEQMQLYAVSAFLRFPELEEVDVELWYTDINDVVRVRYTRHTALKLLAGFEKRIQAMLGCTTFPPNPNVWSCRYCPFSKRVGNGACQAGV